MSRVVRKQIALHVQTRAIAQAFCETFRSPRGIIPRMRRLLRQSLNVAAKLSLVATCVWWAESYAVRDEFLPVPHSPLSGPATRPTSHPADALEIAKARSYKAIEALREYDSEAIANLKSAAYIASEKELTEAKEARRESQGRGQEDDGVVRVLKAERKLEDLTEDLLSADPTHQKLKSEAHKAAADVGRASRETKWVY
jgi:hypothetical protein